MGEPTEQDRDAAYEIHWNTCTDENGLQEAAVKCMAFREQCERAAARAATLAVVERVRAWAKEHEGQGCCSVLDICMLIEREATEP